MNIPTPPFPSLKTSTHQKDWFRAVRPRFVKKHSALATHHTRMIPGRYNPGTLAGSSFPVLYLAENQIVALFEVQALVGSPITVSAIYPFPGAKTWTVLKVHVDLQEVADLTELPQQRIFDANAQELTGDWRAYGYRVPRVTSVGRPSRFPAPTQQLGTALHGVPDLEGFETISAKVPHQRILVVFPDKLHSKSSVTFEDEDGDETWTLKDEEDSN